MNRGLRRWTGCDATFFRVSDGSPTWVDPLDPHILDARDAYRTGGFRELDPWALSRAGSGSAVAGTFDEILGADWEGRCREYRSFLERHGITDYVGVQVGGEEGSHASLSAFNVGRSRGAAWVEEASRRVRAILPALRAGVGAWLRARPSFESRKGMVDEVARATILYDGDGRPVHANSAATHLIAVDPGKARLRSELDAMARELIRARAGDVHRLHGAIGGRIVRTPGGRYFVESVMADGLVRGEADGGVVLTVARDRSRRGSR